MKITDVTPDAVRLGRHPAHAVRPAQQVRRLERARPAADRHRRGRRGPRLPGLGLELGDDRRAGPDHAPQADADGPQSAGSRGARRRSLEAAAPGRRARHRRGRRGAVGHLGQGGRPADPSPARHLSRERCRPMPARPCCRRRRPMPRRRCSSRKMAGPPTRSIRRRAGARTSRSARRCARRSATTPSCSIRPGATITRRRVRVGRAVEEMGFHWYEDPLADQDIYNYVKLKQKLTIPIMATEYPDHRPRLL